jgi:two-component system, chemotaxis family, protein-glutamate methylesterase/glutaminase
MVPGVVSVLIVDDSATMRATMRALLRAHADIEVVGEAHDGEQAVEEAVRLRPDVVTMDVMMPGLDGISSIERLMARAPTRVLVVSSAVEAGGAALSMRAIAAGALELIAKPAANADPRAFAARLAEAIRLMAEVPVVRRHALPRAPTRVTARPVDVIAIAASTGGPPLVATLLGALYGKNAPPVVVAQHLAEGFAAGLARWLHDTTGVPTLVAVDGAPLERGHAYVAPDARDVMVERTIVTTHALAAVVAGLVLRTPAPIGHHRPSADRLLSSVAAACGARSAAMVLTGMGDDGARGLLDVQRAGGLTVAQDPGSAVVGGMPAAAIALGAADDVAAVDGLTSLMSDLAKR